MYGKLLEEKKNGVKRALYSKKMCTMLRIVYIDQQYILQNFSCIQFCENGIHKLGLYLRHLLKNKNRQAFFFFQFNRFLWECRYILFTGLVKCFLLIHVFYCFSINLVLQALFTTHYCQTCNNLQYCFLQSKFNSKSLLNLLGFINLFSHQPVIWHTAM